MDYLLIASCLAFFVGLIHSVLGEILIFKHMRKGGIVPTNGGSMLKERQVRILWATWHIVTVFGWAIALILLREALPGMVGLMPSDFGIIAVAMLASSLLVLFATKGKHPGWIGLLAVAILVWLA